ncbi:hypothetical protein Tco_1247933, partial [Tanacetum coccineum]
MGVRMFRPKINLQEATLEAVKKKSKAVMSSQMGRFGGGSTSYGNMVLADEEMECEVECMEEESPLPDE